ncbi:ethanolamine ammonia-lyase subunit EutC [Bradyrhizobium sp.]|uniref:ethanolamine ammonia-lyase subunit EutC n=1 Tax=Bradyrhizobium sp. TaxID=376 RepID=UPI001EB33863|nr:ethanolamine ammonia-lyase subunit EutC [Bradyrhizobium sp.]MBV9979542.1 ethanolamine ammonia-lyase subunit EutC [Bradyrhizobium sp.]
MQDDRPDRGDQFPDESGGLAHLRRFTPARIGLGRVGSGQSTTATLNFRADHARARDAVHIPLDFAPLEEALGSQGWSVVHLRTAVKDRSEYLRRPDLGRRLSQEARALLQGQAMGSDVVMMAADGLSSSAISGNLTPLAARLRVLLLARRLTLGPFVLVEQGRVAIGDEIGELLNARLGIVLIGERPGLSAADSLGAYITWQPRIGAMDSHRNCISNIRAAGLPIEDAAKQIDDLVSRALSHAMTGVALNDRCSRLAPASVTNSESSPKASSSEAGTASREENTSM